MARNLRTWWHRWLNRFTSSLRQRPRSNPWRRRPFLEALEDRQLLSTVYLVTSTGDSGSGSLRDAITQVNAGKYNEIDFAIGTQGSAQTITPTSALPAITASNVTINGLTQGGSGNTTRLITINGYSGNFSNGIEMDGTNDTIEGLIVQNWYIGFYVNAAGNTLGGTAAGAGNVASGNNRAGVEIASGGSGTQLLGNYIGVNNAGSAAQANSIHGVIDSATNTTIGGTVAGAGNVISGNKSDGISIGSSGVVVEGNLIGTDATGTVAIGNKNGIEVAAKNLTIGGTGPAGRNIISGNTNDGVLLDSSAVGTLVEGNWIGYDVSGQNALGNSVGVAVLSTGNTIGGLAAGTANLISGNKSDGVALSAGSNLVQDNYIGLNHNGDGALANGGNGVGVYASGNTIGGTTTAARNIISGNTGDGILIGSGVTGTLVIGNKIGTDHTLTHALGNSIGIEVAGSGGNTIGGSTSGSRNLISGNSGAGIKVDSGVSGVRIQGNYIGTNSSATSAVANGIGIDLAGTKNTVGGTTGPSRNVISGNSTDGIRIDSGASGNVVQGNFIGTNATGNTALANNNGVEVKGSGNTLGGSVTGARNIIGGNTADGVLLGASGNTVQGNFIGLGSAGGLLANSNGVEDSIGGNTIGGTVTAARNVISGNTIDGVRIDSTASGTLLQGNFIGTSSGGNSAAANLNGVEIAGSGNTLGGTTVAARNVLSGNLANGVLIDSTGSGNVVQGNWIGTNAHAAAVANGSYGVSIAGNNNSIGGTVSGAGNYIADNGSGGIQVQSGTGNTLRRNLIYANGSSQAGPGIVLESGANNNLAAPVLESASYDSTTHIVTVTGYFLPPVANVPYTVEVYASPVGDPEGKIFLGSITRTPTSTAQRGFALKGTISGTNMVLTATLTDSSGNTSAFSTAKNVS